MYSKHIKEKKFPWGGRALAAAFPAHGSISLIGSIRAGSRSAGSGELADIHAAMLLEGTRKRGKKELQHLLDDMGASLSFSSSHSRLLFSGKVLAHNLEALLALIAEIVFEPSFPAAELAVLKNRELANLSHEAQDTHEQASIALRRRIYPKGHPNYPETTDESRKILKGISGTSLRSFHKKILGRKSLVLSVAGSAAPSRVFALAEKYFKGLPDTEVVFKKYPKPSPSRAVLEKVPIPHKASIHYIAGIAAGISKDHPDYIPLLLGMQVLGVPGFAGRMMKSIREEKGLTYGVYAYMPESTISDGVDGHLELWATFAPELFTRGRDAVLQEARLIAEKGATEIEVKKHRELFYNRARVEMSNSGAFAKAAHAVAVEGRSLSYLDAFPKQVLKTTRAQVNRALKKYLRPEQLSETAAGPV